MAEIKQELDKIKARISDANFLANKGLANEVGIHAFKYEPEHELIVRDYIDRLAHTPSDKFRSINVNCADFSINLGRKMLNWPSLEKKKGKDYLLTQLQKVATKMILKMV